ncbi:hypothetical protein [Cetobacterium sp.]|uniref:hypothetical protein n=1 Tax=Cetobacterium sp. TaxID=2071632 RepID=UPI003F3FDAFC
MRNIQEKAMILADEIQRAERELESLMESNSTLTDLDELIAMQEHINNKQIEYSYLTENNF